MIRKALFALWADESGLETVEYAVMSALIVATLVAAVTLLSGNIQTRINGLASVVGTIK